jgi:hypothetical protein
MKLLKYPELVVFLLMIFILGTMWGFVESYLFIFLKELKAPNYLLGKEFLERFNSTSELIVHYLRVLAFYVNFL